MPRETRILSSGSSRANILRIEIVLCYKAKHRVYNFPMLCVILQRKLSPTRCRLCCDRAEFSTMYLKINARRLLYIREILYLCRPDFPVPGLGSVHLILVRGGYMYSTYIFPPRTLFDSQTEILALRSCFFRLDKILKPLAPHPMRRSRLIKIYRISEGNYTLMHQAGSEVFLPIESSYQFSPMPGQALHLLVGVFGRPDSMVASVKVRIRQNSREPHHMLPADKRLCCMIRRV